IGCSIFRKNDRFWGYYPASVWGRLGCWLALLPVQTSGQEHVDKSRSYIFVANHQGAFDIFLIYGFLGHNFKWLMKKGLRKLPLVGKACELAGHVYVDHSSRSGIVQTMQLAREKLQGGVSTVVFPEGTRTLDGKMHPFKKGAFQLALDFKLPIVPMTIAGSYLVLRKGSAMLHWSPLKLIIHQPIETDALTSADLPQLMESVWQTISKPLITN
ncbi:MAG: 1-acyl-sn-glycerol-3-phosphate acyltransferase, partial [Bacteroidales bacterium]|nr:1-acyl-sn-glycerol-3-phosphate acyltransferase [Bacteroidales bacterium]